MRSQILCILFLFSFVTLISGQASVQFTDISLDRALDRAKDKKKLVFVDTYAPWCIPCKKMNAEFRDKDLARFFNKNFVNLRVNMDDTGGKQMYSQYQIVFLPTLLILDAEGNVVFKVDRALSAKELLNIAKQVVNPKPRIIASTKTTTPKPSPKKEVVVASAPTTRPTTPSTKAEPKPTTKPEVETSSIPEKEEKILYVLDSDTKMPPEVLYQEAYFRMQLMDNSHKSVVKEYLDSQEDWGTEQNMIFIYDFLSSTETRAFKYFIKERTAFENRFGADNVAQTIEILVDEKLQRGFPRPTLEESINLLNLVDPKQGEMIAYEYFLERLYAQGDYIEFEEYALDYLRGPGASDHQVLFRMVELKLRTRKKLTKKDYKQCLAWINRAVEINNKNFKYWDTQAYLYYKIFDKKNAIKSNERSIALAKSYNQDIEELQILKEMISELN